MVRDRHDHNSLVHGLHDRHIATVFDEKFLRQDEHGETIQSQRTCDALAQYKENAYR